MSPLAPLRRSVTAAACLAGCLQLRLTERAVAITIGTLKDAINAPLIAFVRTCKELIAAQLTVAVCVGLGKTGSATVAQLFSGYLAIAVYVGIRTKRSTELIVADETIMVFVSFCMNAFTVLAVFAIGTSCLRTLFSAGAFMARFKSFGRKYFS